MKICFISAVKKVLALTAVIAVASVFAGRECVKVGKTDVYLLETGGIFHYFQRLSRALR